MTTPEASDRDLKPQTAAHGALPMLDLGALALPLTAAEVFGRPCPFELELGGGKGRFMLRWAEAHAEIGLLVVERARKYCLAAATTAARHGLGNVRTVVTTAEDLLFRCLAPGTLSAVHVYFPDPWPKKRHHKRRFVRPDNIARIADLLAPGGMLRVKTDHQQYAEVIADVLAGEPALHATDLECAFAEVPPTNYEIKYGRESRAVFRFARVRARGAA
jgi:tRNA (guanine-N7-)-methyltransferase